MNKISRKGFLKIAAAAAMSGVTAGALAACNAAKDSAAASAPEYRKHPRAHNLRPYGWAAIKT